MREESVSLSLVDIVVFIAENWLLIFVAPLAVAIIFYAWQSMTPGVYVAGLDAVIPQEIELSPDEDRPLTGIYPPPFVEMEGVQTSLTRTGFSIRAEGSSPGQAQNRAEAAYRATVAPIVVALERERLKADSIVAVVDDMVESLESDLAGNIENAVALLELETVLAPVEARLHGTQAVITALEAVPAVTVARSGMEPAQVGVLAGVGAALLTVLALAVRQGWRSIAATEEGRLKLGRIRNAFVLRH